ncbi:MAG: hypothetical protein H0W07_08360 [Chloroflexi bacterium]|nr:hypothetical protein [Chloroflexota bacterium]
MIARLGEVATGIRPIIPADLPGCASVFYAALDELTARHGQPPPIRNEAGMIGFFGHLLTTDGERAWLSGGIDGVDAFGFAHLRGSLWFLSFLFVRPESQAQGVGRQVLLRTFPHDPSAAADDGMGGASAWNGVLATCADSIQPVSTGLYTGYGMVPRLPLFTMLGRPRRGVLPGLPRSVERCGFDDLVDTAPDGHRRLVDLVGEIDQQVLGYDRPVDHRFWRVADRRGWVYRDRADGAILGYGYAQPSGRLGPVALLDGELLPAVLGDLMSTLQPAGDWQIFVPGAAERVMVALLHAGFRCEGTPALYCASRIGPDLSRYIVASFALL